MRPPLVLLALAAAAPAIAADTVGPETCKACHPAAYETWRASPHARALESLPERSRNDRRCLSCHAPQSEEGLTGVSCEACHGAGGLYAARYVMRDEELSQALGLVDPGERTCLACHTDSTPSLEKFEYARKLPLILHRTQPVPPLPPSPPPGAARPPPGKKSP